MLKPSQFALLSLAVLAVSASQAEAERFVADYEIAWEGLHIGGFDTELVADPERYRITYSARTEGLLGWLFPFVSGGFSEGRRADRQTIAEHYQGGSEYRDETHSWAVTFDTDGQAAEILVPAEDLAERDPVPEALRIAPDPLALALGAIGQAEPGLRLEGTSFDGKRALRFELACADALTPVTDVPAGAAAAANREELVCTVGGKLVAGSSERWRQRNQDNEQREPATVWLRRGLVEGGFWPVRVEATTRFGAVTVELVNIETIASPTPN